MPAFHGNLLFMPELIGATTIGSGTVPVTLLLPVAFERLANACEPFELSMVECVQGENSMTTPNPAIIPGVLPGDLVPERADLLPEEPHLGNPDADSKDGMPNNPETPELVPGDI